MLVGIMEHWLAATSALNEELYSEKMQVGGKVQRRALWKAI